MREKSILSRFPHIHTGRELELMLAAKKPLACFSEAERCLPNEDIIPEVSFSPYVQEGILERLEFDLDSLVPDREGIRNKIKYVLFALPGETWRAVAMRLLLTQYSLSGQWNETCERIEGKLLGYTDDENEIWCDWLRGKDLAD